MAGTIYGPKEQNEPHPVRAAEDQPMNSNCESHDRSRTADKLSFLGFSSCIPDEGGNKSVHTSDSLALSPVSGQSSGSSIDGEVYAAVEGLVNALALLDESVQTAKQNLDEFLTHLGVDAPRRYLRDLGDWLTFKECLKDAQQANDKAQIEACAAKIDDLEDRLPPISVILRQWNDAKQTESIKPNIW